MQTLLSLNDPISLPTGSKTHMLYTHTDIHMKHTGRQADIQACMHTCKTYARRTHIHSDVHTCWHSYMHTCLPSLSLLPSVPPSCPPSLPTHLYLYIFTYPISLLHTQTDKHTCTEVTVKAEQLTSMLKTLIDMASGGFMTLYIHIYIYELTSASTN